MICIERPVALASGARVHPSMGSLIQGALMELLPREAAAALHQPALRPYAQALYYDRARQAAVWRLGCLTDAAAAAFAEALAGKTRLALAKRDDALLLGAPVETCESSYRALADAIFTDARRPLGCDLRVRTPAAFKRQGAFVNVPERFLLFQNLLARWNAFTDAARIEEPDLARHLADACRMTAYALSTQRFSVEGKAVTGFCGTMRLRFRGNDMTCRLAALLLRFAAFAGVGAKTAMGMGATDASLLF